MTEAISVRRLTKRYGRLTALDDVSLAVHEGEMFGLIGPDGAGKSTLYKILSTLLRPDSGEALIGKLDTVGDYRQIRSAIGYMPQRFSLYQDLTVSENLRFFASLFGTDVKANYDLIAPIFSQLERFPHRKAGALSGGMKQKLALSCALIHRPRILLLDEPTTGVDAVSRSELWDMLGTLKERGITILVSTSYMDEADRCERIAMIDKGKILRIDTPRALAASMDENLYDAAGPDMFKLLSAFRNFPGVEDCYTFGATLHLVAERGFRPGETIRQLSERGVDDVRITPAKGTIEDLFIKLTRDDNPR